MSQSMIRVALVVEAGRLRDELRTVIRTSDRLQTESTLSDAADLESFGLGTADAIVFDDSPSSLEHAQLAHAAGVPVVVMTDDVEVAASLRDLRSGLGLLPTSATAEEVVAAIEAASAGLFVVHGDLINEDQARAPGRALALPEPLTPREVEVLHALAAGLGNKAIATQLHISEHTAKFHVGQILAKLDAGSRAEAVSIAMRRGLLPL
jgi:two-component system, NarL family, response regulator YdfI